MGLSHAGGGTAATGISDAPLHAEGWTARVARCCAARHRSVLCCWVLVLVLGALAGSMLSPLLTSSLSLPGTTTQTADGILASRFNDSVEGTFLVVVRVPDATTDVQHAVERSVANVVGAVPTASVTGVEGAAGVVVVAVGTRLGLQQATAQTTALRHAIDESGLHGALVTGPPALQADVTPLLARDLRVGDAVAVLLALALLVLLLGWSWAAVLPIAVAATTTAGSLGVIFLVAHQVPMSLYAPNVVELIGFGLSVDYSLLIVQRFRLEAADADRPVLDAIAATMATAGRTVVQSALAVALGLAALLAIPVPFVRSLGAAGVVVPLAASAGAVTLLPALLATVHATRRMPAGSRGSSHAVSWQRIAAAVTGHPRVVAGACSLVLVACATPALWLQLTSATLTEVPSTLQSSRGLAVVAGALGPGAATPIEVVVDAGGPGEMRSARYQAATLRFADAVLDDPTVFAVAIGPGWPYVDATGRYGRVLVVSDAAFGAASTQGLVTQVAADVAAARFPSGATVTVGGAPAIGAEFLARVYGWFWWIAGIVLLAACCYLFVAFGSLALAVLCISLDVVSLAATTGVVVACFRGGIGRDVLGLFQAGQIDGWVPVFLFAVLFGLSMDYQVFLVSRMREAHDAGLDAVDAIRDGLVHTGRVVSGAAVIFVCALGGLVFSQVGGLAELGVGLAVGVAIDAAIVRLALLPAVMALCGERVWWPATGRPPDIDAPSPESRGTGRGDHRVT